MITWTKFNVLADFSAIAQLGFGKRFHARECTGAKALAFNVTRLRQAKGLPSRENAEIEQQSLRLIENARVNPTIATMEHIAAVLGVNFLDLFAATPNAERTKEC